MPEWELLKIKELADLLQLNQQTVRNMVNRGELEYVKFGRTKYIPRAAAVKLAGGTGTEMRELLTVAQVAELLQLNRQTIWNLNWIGAGTFPALKIGDRRYRIKRADLDAWLNARPYASAREFWGGAILVNVGAPAAMPVPWQLVARKSHDVRRSDRRPYGGPNPRLRVRAFVTADFRQPIPSLPHPSKLGSD